MIVESILYPNRTIITNSNGKKIIRENNITAWQKSIHKNTKTISTMSDSDFSMLLTAQKLTEEYYKKYQEKQIHCAYKFIRENGVSLIDLIEEDLLELKTYAKQKYPSAPESEKQRFKRNISSYINILYGFTKRISDQSRVAKIKELIGITNKVLQSLSSKSSELI